MVRMWPTQWDHSVTVGPNFSPRGCPGPQKGLLGPRWAFWGPNGPFWAPHGYRKGPRVGQHDILSCIIPKRSVLGSLWPFQGVIWHACQFLPVRDLQRLKISISPYWKIFGGWALPSFSDIVIDPKGYFLCDFNKFEGYVFEKNWFFCIPYFGQKQPFFGPEGPILTQNLKNIVYQVVISQNNPFQGFN